jgi:hypothetical protein
MRTHLVWLSVLLSGSLACGQNNTKKDPLLTKPPVNQTQPVSNKTPDTAPNTTPATSSSAPASMASAPSSSVVSDLPSLSSFLEKGTEITEEKTFTYNFEKGKTAAYQISIRWKLKGSLPIGLPLGDFSGAFVADLNWSIKEVDDKGEATVELTYGRIQAEFEALAFGGAKKIDSRSKDQIVPDALLMPFSKMDGKTFSMKISKEGKITTLTGQDKILEEVLSDPSFPKELKTQIMAAIGEEGLKQVLGQGFLAFPSTPIKKATPFRVTGNPLIVPGLGQIYLQEDVSLESIRLIDGKTLGLFSLDLFAIVDSTGGASVAKLPGFGLKGEATATEGNGFFIFDLDRGLPSSVALPVPLDMRLTFLNAEGAPQNSEPINVTGDVTLTAKLIE